MSFVKKMSLTPRQILQHMELPPGSLDARWPNGRNVFVLGSLERVRLTLLSQQIRALNLIYALAAEDRITSNTSIVIVGAGPAGLTAAKAATRLQAKTFVLERKDRPLAVFCPKTNGLLGNPLRYVHPGLEHWPRQGWNTKKALLPLMGWHAGTPKDVALKIANEFDKQDPYAHKDHTMPTVYLDVGASFSYGIEESGSPSPKWKVVGTGVKMDKCEDFFNELPHKKGGIKSSSNGPAATGPTRDEFYISADILILAVGFGNDGQKGNGTKPYWEFDQEFFKLLNSVDPKDFIVSGVGDGGLADAFDICLWKNIDIENLTTHPQKFPQWRMQKELSQLELKTPDLHSKLIILEGTIQRKQHDEREIQRGYNNLLKNSWEKNGKNPLLNFILKLRNQATRGANHHVSLVSKNDAPYKRETLAINRFLAWCLSEDLTQLDDSTKEKLKKMSGKDTPVQSRIKHVIGHVPLSRENGNKVTLRDPRKDGISMTKKTLSGHLITRHGTRGRGSLQRHFPTFHEAAVSHLSAPNLLDQTREAAWPENFFGREQSPREFSPAKAYFQIDKVTMDYEISLHEPGRGGGWLYISGKYTYDLKKKDSNGKKELLIEHHALPIPRADLRVVSAIYKRDSISRRSKPKTEDYFEESSSRSRQNSSIAYLLKYPNNTEDGDSIEVEVSAFQCGAIGMPDAIGFRLYPECKLRNLKINITLNDNLIAEKLIGANGSKSFAGGMRPYREPLRRASYEDGTDGGGRADLVTPNGKRTYSKTWDKNDLIRGYFHGLCWDRLSVRRDP